MTFAVVAEGSNDLSYEWLKDGVPIRDPSVKARSSIFTIPSFLPAEHKGSYQCIVSSDYDGSVDLAMSKPAELKGNTLIVVYLTWNGSLKLKLSTKMICCVIPI